MQKIAEFWPAEITLYSTHSGGPRALAG